MWIIKSNSFLVQNCKSKALRVPAGASAKALRHPPKTIFSDSIFTLPTFIHSNYASDAQYRTYNLMIRKRYRHLLVQSINHVLCSSNSVLFSFKTLSKLSTDRRFCFGKRRATYVFCLIFNCLHNAQARTQSYKDLK